MRTIEYYKNNKSGNCLHIETEGCIVNIRVGLTNMAEQEVTSIEIIPDRAGEKWILEGTNNNRVIKIFED